MIDFDLKKKLREAAKTKPDMSSGDKLAMAALLEIERLERRLSTNSRGCNHCNCHTNSSGNVVCCKCGHYLEPSKSINL